MRRSGVEALIPRALAASALALVALASPTALAFALDADLHVVVPVSLHESIPVDLPVAGVVEAPPATADRMVDRAEAALFEPADAQQDPQEGSPEAGAQPQDAPAPILAAGIPLPLATVGAIPVLRDLGQPLPMGLGPLLEGAPAPAAAPAAPPPAAIAPQAEAVTLAPPPSPVSVGASLAAVAAVGAAAPALFGWDRLRRFLLPLALYTRIAKERLLDHGSREKLLLAIRERPGLPVADLASGTGVPRNTATYHLRRLEREGLVVSQRSGRVRVWFLVGGDARRDEAPAYAALRHGVTRAIAMQVAAQPGVDQQALCARFGLAPSLAHWHVDRLLQTGLVRKERDGRHVRYYPTEGLPRVAALTG